MRDPNQRPDEAATPPLRLSAFSGALLVLSALWCAFLFRYTRGYIDDDAFIHLEFARSFARGAGFAFNGHVVYGDTSPLWVLLLRYLHILFDDWILTAKTLCIFGLLFAAAGLFFFAWRAQPPGRDPARTPSALVLLFVLNPFVCYWAFSGMEAITAAGITFWCAGLLFRERSHRDYIALCALAGAGIILRPEMLFLAALLGVVMLWRFRRLAGSLALRLPTLLAGVILFLTPAIVWLRYAHHAFGSFVPNTNAAKRDTAGNSVLHRLLEVYALGSPLVFVLTAVLLTLAVLHLRRRTAPPSTGRHPVPGALALSCALFAIWALICAAFYIHNHTYVQTRYIAALAPGLMFAALLLLNALSPRAARGVYALGIVLAAATTLRVAFPALHNKTASVEAGRRMALFIRDHLPPDAAVASYAIGELAFYSEHPIVDTGGITRPGVVPFLGDDAATLHWAEREGVQFYIADHPIEPGSTLVFSTPTPVANSWSLHRSVYDIQAALNLWALPATPPTLPRVLPVAP